MMTTTTTTSTSASQGSSNTKARSTDATRPADARSLDEPRELFERALRARSGTQDDEAAPSDLAAEGIAAALIAAPPLHQARAVAQAPAPAGQIETVSTGPRAAIEAALNANSCPVVTPVGGTDPAGVWEASIREPNSVAVEVRATRVEKSAFEAHAPVTLTIASSTVDASVLGRHVSRLNERLRKHAVGPTHARIKSNLGEAE